MVRWDQLTAVAKYLKNSGYNHALVYANWYFTNVELFEKKKVGDKWVVEWPFPDGFPMIGFAAEQIGEWARLVFRDPAKWNGEFPPPESRLTYRRKVYPL